ncbi:MAG: sensor histidine kinase [Halobellus sp.]|uniref:sensor histidine kinase n=1 Tax=Halobellus sp. TaxID=1979212 RepID=UPI0035D4434A
MVPVSDADVLPLQPYVDSGYGASRDELDSALEALEDSTDLAFGGLADAAEFDTDSLSPKHAGAIVFATGPDVVPEHIDRPTVWVSTDAATAARAIEAGAIDVLTWKPGTDPSLLAAKCARAFESVEAPGVDIDADRSASVNDWKRVRALERIEDGIIEIDSTDRITYVNSAAAGFLDAERAEAVGTVLGDLLSEETAEQLSDQLREARSTGEVTGVEITTPNDRWFDVTLYPDGDGTEGDLEGARLEAVRGVVPPAIRDALEDVHGQDGGVKREVRVPTTDGVSFYLLRSVSYRSEGVERAFVVLTDVTEVKRQGTHLQVLHRLLRHNLRNRTNVIQGHADLIEARAEKEQIGTYAEQIASACQALVNTSETARAIQRVLRNSDAEPERLSPADAETRLRRLVSATAGADAVDVQVTVDVATSVRYDELVESGLRELLENAIEYGTPDPDAVVEISVTSDDGTVRFAVSDDGPGIPEAEWSVVTEDREITQLQHASGLGLWLVKWVADARGGDLKLVVTDEPGTTVAMDLPA